MESTFATFSHTTRLDGHALPMTRIAVCVALILTVHPVAMGQDKAAEQGPTITLYLPSGFPAETVQVRYFMVGEFGGYGGGVRPEEGAQSLDIPASVDGKPASLVKIIAYLPGCEIFTLSVPIEGTATWRQLLCKPLGKIPLHGQIVPFSLAPEQSVSVEVAYEADWDHGFFPIMDGFVTTLRLANVTPDAEGKFDVDVPDFAAQSALGKARLTFLLRDNATGNIVAFLRVADPKGRLDDLEVLSSYLPVVTFVALPND